ncbi:hypothetical protein FLK61_28540 [Paenalkalicoccus suaedae]|uniref:YokE-like PH domain-containing protein n=1 Tax=Paenalkalicoccus suaedae TaxID=2592382 RepID=A0A859FCN3_9BACI|nr:hypothetical protein [Paenalkalicoccus suaedae]QKS70690.1 hypothetical protein FLK61_28540 [Paenalkalicoccus suaedae]
MEPIATLPYFKVQREMSSIEMKNVEYERKLYLFEDRLLTKHREFPTEQIFDMSHREMSGEDSILYLHTSRGVYSYTIKDDPTTFIQAFKRLEKQILEEKAKE